MNIDAFWSIVDSIKDDAQPEVALADELRALPPGDLVSFQAHFDRLFAEAYRVDLWGAAYAIGGGCSDDAFIDFRYGLISRGRAVYDKALACPDSLADLGERADLENEGFGYVAKQVYEEKTGSPMPRGEVRHPSDPVGETWDIEDESEASKRLPRLTALMAQLWEQRLHMAEEMLKSYTPYNPGKNGPEK